MTNAIRSSLTFRRFVWGVLLYNILVVVWGAFVRATKSGDGCGAHWPSCQGTLIPQGSPFKTWVEFGHRVSSGLVLVLVLALFIWAWRAFPKKHAVRYGARLALLFTFSEALIGAGLVLYKLVAHNPSNYRAVALCAHLLNTLVLLAVISLTAHWAAGHPRMKLAGERALSLLVAVGGTVLIAVTGALSALGDTLYPASSLTEGIRHDFTHDAAFIVKQRPLHPTAAFLFTAFVCWLALKQAQAHPQMARRSYLLAVLFAAQFVVGIVNLGLLAPVWMQMIHLASADAAWIALVLWAATVLETQASTQQAFESVKATPETVTESPASEVTWPSKQPSRV